MSCRSLSIFLASVVLGVFPLMAAQQPAQAKLAAGALARVPLTFEANHGQFDAPVRFLSRTPRYTMFLTPNETVLQLRGAGTEHDVIRWHLSGANSDPVIRGERPLETRTNYFRGNDRRNWRTGVDNFAQVRYERVYPGVDLVFRGDQQQVEYDFTLAPNANAKQIRFAFDGVDSMTTDKDGALLLRTPHGTLMQSRPLVYQEIDGRRRVVDARYRVSGKAAGFALGSYDHSKPLIIDPVLAWSTYLGGSIEDYGYAIAVDGSGNTYITGATGSTDFPTANPIYGTKGYDWDVFVAKINAAGTALVYSTYLSANGWNEYGLGIAVDSSGNAYVTGATNATDFPGVTAGSIQPAFGGTGSNRDAFALKINAAGNAILWSTYLGGAADDIADGITVDSSGNAYVAGSTQSSSIPWIGAGAIQSTYGGGNYDGFVIKIDTSGAKVWSTYLGGSGDDGVGVVRIDGSGNAWIGGSTDSTSWPGVSGSSLQSTNAGSYDATLTEINAAGTAISYATFLGASGYDYLSALALDASGNVYVTGYTDSTSFPGVTGSSIQPSNAGSYDIWVAKLNPAATSITWATFLGGSDFDLTSDLDVDSSGNVYISGSTASTDFPVSSAIQSTYGGGSDALAAKINAAGTAVIWSTYLGGNDDDQSYGGVLDSSGNFYITGFTASSAFTGTSGSALQPTYGGGYDAWVVKIGNTASPSLTSINPTSGVPGTQVTLTGSGFGAVQGTGSVWLGNKLAGSIVSWSDTQIVATVATNVASGSASVQQAGTWSNSITFTIITPTISSISPSSGVPGTQVTINGTNFGATQGSGQVWLGSTYAGSIVSWSNTQIVATVAANSTSGNAQVQQSGVWGNQIAFTVTSPSISSISPTTARAGDSITITGTNFGATQGTGQVWLGSKLAGSYASWSNTQIVATVASGATSGSAQVKQSGVWGNQVPITILTPNITSVSPTTARAGDSITITGTNFGATQGTGQVWLGSKLAGSYVSWSDTQIVATVASGSVTGTAQVQQGGVWANYGTFTVITPVLSSISPASGPVGTQVTFTGTGFGTTQGSGKVWLANKYATIVSWSDTQVVATVIAGSTTSASQVYQNGVWSNTISFTVTP
jgi:IPT/TIG domain-containing protein/beta-propeller repeat-containing protein